MDYVVLAAGRGKRLNPLTNVMQKCMYPILGKPFLQYTIDDLIDELFDAENDALTIVVGYFAKQVMGYFGTNYRGIPVNYVMQHDQLGVGHAIHCANTSLRIEGPVVAWLGDVYFAPDILRRAGDCDGDALVYIRLEDTPELAAAPLFVESGRAVSIPMDFAEDDDVGNAADIGCWRLTRDARDKLPRANKEGEWRLVRALAQRIDEGHIVEAVQSDEWIHLGNTPSVLDRLGRVTKRLAPDGLFE